MLDDIQRLGLSPEESGPCALPSHRHLPGTGTAPDMTLLEAIKARCPASVLDTRWQDNPTYRYGWLLFANEYFWETHEVWETVWMSAPVNSRERYLMQCLIQLANARLKRRLERPGATDRLLAQCRDLAHSAFAPIPGRIHEPLLGLTPETLSHQIENA